MTRVLPRTGLIAERDRLAEQANRAFAHNHPDAERLGGLLGDLEDLLATTDPRAHHHLAEEWLRTDADLLDAHLTGQAPNCPDCRQTGPQPHTTT